MMKRKQYKKSRYRKRIARAIKRALYVVKEWNSTERMVKQMPPHEEEFMSGQLFIKDENGQYTPFMGIQDCTDTIAAELDEDGQEWSYEGIDWAAGNDLTFTLRQTKQQARRTTKRLRRIGNHARRIKRHEKRLKERARRSVLKQKDWFVLRDKDGGQVCVDWHKRLNEPGRFFVRYKRKRVKWEE